MDSQARKVKTSVALLSAALLFLFALSALGGDEMLPGSDCESLTQHAKPAAAAVQVDDPLVEAFHQARRNGDGAELRRIEALFPQSFAGGESAEGLTLRPTTTQGFEGERVNEYPQGLQKGQKDGSSLAFFGDDHKVRPTNYSSAEYNEAMASDSMGNLYVVWQDDYYSGGDYVQVYKSSDGGETWIAFGYVSNASADLREPSLAVGEGSNGDALLLAYIVDDGVNLAVPEVAVKPLSGGSFVAHSVPVWTHWEGYAKPVIITDAFQFSPWYAYLTCAGIMDSATQNINVCSFRSTDSGETWGDANVVFGNTDDYAWLDPDISFGTTKDRVFIVTFNDDDNTLYVVYSTNYGVSWNPPVSFYTMSLVPGNPVDPEIAAAVDHDNVMVCCTKYFAGYEDNIGQGYSQDAGATWSTLFSLEGYTGRDEYAVSLTACEGGGSWHLAYMDGPTHTIRYSRRLQDMSGYWQPTPYVVDDLSFAGSLDNKGKMGIAALWSSDLACIAWADARDNSPGDYDAYADFGNNTGLMASDSQFSELSGGSIVFSLNAGSSNGSKPYLLLGGLSGYQPGTLLPGGTVLPLNLDVFSYEVVLPLVNTSIFQNFMGYLSPSGSATATFNAPPVPGYAYFTIHFAYLVGGVHKWTSNPVAITIFPGS